ncbi:MAG: septum formation initiator family protein [Clostridia bacterium]|nr:septum formation initiator family protein [Clostridia bacterium]MBQ4086273.1 septum formation initiator family protein [Clostridia bacterium]
MARSRRRVQPRFWLILIALMLSAFALVWSSQQDLIEQREAMIEELTAAREQMEIEIAEAQRQLQFSKSDEYIERLARSELGLVMPDEVLYVSPQND